ncbi:MAG: hypothetical protein GX435_09735 [Exilispira sp.]|nr:hypothetical protein [Exilispira sp.]
MENFYEKLNNYLKTTYIDGITEDKFKTSFSLTDFSLTDEEAKSLKQKCSDTVNKIIDGIFANKKSTEIVNAIKQVTEIIGCINDYTIGDEISLQIWYQDKIKIKSSEEKSLLENTLNNFINDMKLSNTLNSDVLNISFAEIESAIDFENAVKSYSNIPIIDRLKDILNTGYFKNLANKEPEKAKMALVQFLSMYGHYKSNVEIYNKIEKIYSNDFEDRTQLKKIIEDIRVEYDKIFNNEEINSLLPTLFLENIEEVKSFCVDYCMQDIILITEDGQNLKKQMEDYIKEKDTSSIYISKESFDGWIETLKSFVYEPINPEDDLITDAIAKRYIDETIMKYRILFGSKLVAGCSSESEAVDILKDICGIEEDFALFLYKQGALTQSNAAYASQLYSSFVVDGKGTYALQNLVNTMSKVAANLSIYSEKASIKSIIEKFVNDCKSGSDAKQAYATYVSYMNDEGISYSNAVEEFKKGNISSEELKAILSYINLSNNDIDTILSQLWLE